MSQAFSGFGTAVNLETSASPFVFDLIEEVQTVEFTGSKVDLVDVTNMQSPSAYREYLATLKDAGELQFTANFLPAASGQGLLQSAFESRAVQQWKVTLPSSLGEFDFAGIVTSIDHSLTFDKEAKLTVKVKITGPNVFTA
jgi:predicted secreted protein